MSNVKNHDRLEATDYQMVNGKWDSSTILDYVVGLIEALLLAGLQKINFVRVDVGSGIKKVVSE